MRFFRNFFSVSKRSQLKGEPLEEKKFSKKKFHKAEKLKGGTLWGFSTSILSQNIKKLKGEIFSFSKKISHTKKTEKGTLWDFQHPFCVAKHRQIEGEKFLIFQKKISQCRKKLKRGPFGIFNVHSVSQNIKKIEGGPFWGENVPKKVSQCRKKIERGDPLVSPGMACYAGKQENRFWFNSLGHMV